MIIEFSVKNYRSIRDLQTISFKATGLKSPTGNDIDADNIVKSNGVSLLKTVGLYGANASGKSNMLMALSYFTRALSSLSIASKLLVPLYDPFLFGTTDEGCLFQIVVLLNGKKFRYGFVVNKVETALEKGDSTSIIIESEWLYGNVDKNMKRLFLRVGNGVKENNLPTSEGMIIPTKLPYPYTLFLAYAAAFDAKGIPEQIVSNITFHTIDNIIDKSLFRDVSISIIKKSAPLFLSFLKRFNMKYDDIELIDDESYPDNDYSNFPLNKVLLKRTIHDGNNKPLSMNLEYRESSGNKKIFDLAGILLAAFNRKNDPFLIVIDEIDSNFHPSLLIKLIKMFNNPKINKNNSQLLFTSHDTNLMSPSIMRRDQFYFAEKQEDESTRLYSLADLRGIRNDADFATQYLAGYYGALPVLNDYTEVEENENGKQ
ncbi:abortive infection protein [Prevotella nigrescens]|uniref:AAA family ATPase n=1 Tax=Prevotella nigrescens TaxID=28133 RepID=UPI000B4DCB4D|nr:ATP-binding protein [Prevotella nigrescens]OWP28889.1 abortive infection protein [Prevotella nigrescens]